MQVDFLHNRYLIHFTIIFIYNSQRIHVWHIYLHLVDFCGKSSPMDPLWIGIHNPHEIQQNKSSLYNRFKATHHHPRHVFLQLPPLPMPEFHPWSRSAALHATRPSGRCVRSVGGHERSGCCRLFWGLAAAVMIPFFLFWQGVHDQTKRIVRSEFIVNRMV